MLQFFVCTKNPLYVVYMKNHMYISQIEANNMEDKLSGLTITGGTRLKVAG